MDFLYEFDKIPEYNTYYIKLKDRILELEKYKDETVINHQIISMNILGIIDNLKLHEERLNRHNEYCNNIHRKMRELENNIYKIKLDHENKLNEIIHFQILELKEIVQKQKNQEKQILELKEIIQKQENQDKQIFDIQEIIQKQKNQEKQILELKKIIEKQKDENKETIEIKEVKEINQNKSKRKFNDVTNDYIERLILTKKRSKPWSEGMSKYISITVVNDRWRWESNIFDENHINFKLKEDAEKHFETIIAKYNIDPIYITRIGYEDK